MLYPLSPYCPLIRRGLEGKTGLKVPPFAVTTDLFEILPLYMYIKNARGLYLACNRQFSDLLALDQAALLGQKDHVIKNQKSELSFKKVI